MKKGVPVQIAALGWSMARFIGRTCVDASQHRHIAGDCEIGKFLPFLPFSITFSSLHFSLVYCEIRTIRS